ncbi:MAG: alpha/beta family hydrolase [Pyrinomonadaceae bacterium]
MITIDPESFRIPVMENEGTSGLLYRAHKHARKAATIILGHGAGANQSSSFMRLISMGLAARGVDVVTFNFLYMENGRRAPDPKVRLELCYRSVIASVLTNNKLAKNRLFIGGKSMGGRIASQVAAWSAEADSELAAKLTGLVFLGYPLHPPGNPLKLRTEHLPKIQLPMLFVQGTRDTLGAVEEIRAVVKQLRLPAEIFAIEGGDHSLKVTKKTNIQQEVYDRILDTIVRWCSER